MPSNFQTYFQKFNTIYKKFLNANILTPNNIFITKFDIFHFFFVVVLLKKKNQQNIYIYEQKKKEENVNDKQIQGQKYLPYQNKPHKTLNFISSKKVKKNEIFICIKIMCMVDIKNY